MYTLPKNRNGHKANINMSLLSYQLDLSLHLVWQKFYCAERDRKVHGEGDFARPRQSGLPERTGLAETKPGEDKRRSQMLQLRAQNRRSERGSDDRDAQVSADGGEPRRRGPAARSTQRNE